MDLWTAAAERDRQIRIVGENAGDWIASAVEAIRSIAREQATLTASDVWKRVGEPDEPRAMGAAIVKARAAGIIEPSGLPPVSTERANARKMPRWASRLYRPANGWEAANRELKAGRIARFLIGAGAAPDVVASLTPDQWATVATLANVKNPSDATCIRALEILRDAERDGAA